MSKNNLSTFLTLLYCYFPYKRMDHRTILLYGFHFSFLLIFALAVTRDLLFDNYFNASINFTAWVVSAISYYLLHFKSKTTVTSYLIMGVAIFPLYLLIYFNHFGNMVIVYVILLPLASFFLLPFKKALSVNFFIYSLLTLMLYYISTVQPDAPILNNPLALINIGFASLLIIFFGIFYHLAVESSLSKLTHSNHQKDILLQEVHHRVKNNLNVTAAMLGLQAIHEPEQIKSHILKSKSRIEAIATVHEMLYRQESFEEVLFYDYIVQLEKLLEKAYSNSDYQFRISVHKSLSLPLDTMVQFGLILNEILTNTFKHAKNAEGLQIDISLKKVSEGYLFHYKDNGTVNLSQEELLKHRGLGTKLVELSAKQINAKLMVYYKNGLNYTLRIESA